MRTRLQRLAVAGVITCGIMAASGCSSTTIPVTIEVTDNAGPSISPTFMGISTEWGYTQNAMGDSETGVNESYRQLIRNLAAYGSGPMIIRIGGNSTESTGWPNATTVRPFAEFANAVGAHFYLGVNLYANNLALATAQAKSYTSNMPAEYMDAIEIGNEPDNNSMHFDYAAYLDKFNRWKSNIEPMLPSAARIMAPSWTRATSLQDYGIDFISSEGNTVAPFSQHFYITGANNSLPQDFLLLQSSATMAPDEFAPYTVKAHQAGVPFRVGEMNSLFGGGKDGISNTFQASLWELDLMFRLIDVGVDGVNWHTGNNNYSLFVTDVNHSGPKTTFATTVRPPYYGLLLFQQAVGNTANGTAHLISAKTKTNANLTAWATVDDKGTHRLVVINKDKSYRGTVAVKIHGYQHAEVVRLTADNYLSKTGITLAGQTFDNSADGKPVGTRTVETYDMADGKFSIPMGVTSAALITFKQ